MFPERRDMILWISGACDVGKSALAKALAEKGNGREPMVFVRITQVSAWHRRNCAAKGRAL